MRSPGGERTPPRRENGAVRMQSLVEYASLVKEVLFCLGLFALRTSPSSPTVGPRAVRAAKPDGFVCPPMVSILRRHLTGHLQPGNWWRLMYAVAGVPEH